MYTYIIRGDGSASCVFAARLLADQPLSISVTKRGHPTVRSSGCRWASST